jgi:hypothetical protein
MRQRLTALAALAATGLIASVASAVPVYGITMQNNLFSFDSAAPSAVLTGVYVTGLQTNEVITGIDVRPSTGEIFGAGSTGRLYTLNPTTGAATLVGSGFAPNPSGTEFGFDFNPTIDRIRLVSDTDANYVLNPITGATQLVATNLFYGPADPNFGANPSIVGSAYTNSSPIGTTTQLYGIDSVLNTLVTQANNAGTLGTVGALGIDVSNLVGFDIAGANNTAYLSSNLGPADTSKLYTVNLATGATTLVGEIGGGLFVRDITVAIPEPASLGLLGGLAVLTLRRRK